MAVRVIMPKLGMEMTKASVAAWSVKEGERVEKGDRIVVIETEKITYEVEAPASGTLRKIVTHEGEEKAIGELLGVITSDGEAFDEQDLAREEVPPKSGTVDKGQPTPHPSENRTGEVKRAEAVISTPAAKRLAKEMGIDIQTVTGSGPAGRISERDVRAAAEARQGPKLERAAARGSARLGMDMAATQMRGIIAQRLSESWRAPHIYLATEVDATEVVKLRTELVPLIARETGKTLTYNDILIKIVSLGIEEFPILNGTFAGDHIRIPEEINMGLAVAVEDGLVVPVVRRANAKRLTEIVVEREDLVERARARKLRLEELRGGTFSISNLGMFEVEFFTAILNPPESGILSVGRMKETPVVSGGAITIKPILKLVLGVDHRVVDGAVGAQFLQEVKRLLEDPRRHLTPA
jgi:pyruvate dehydrogenase E2 component (dihydrolipoamide acetyltransferase)